MPPKKARGVAGYATAMETAYFNHYDEQVAKSGAVKTAVLFQVGTFFELYDYVDKVTGAPRTNVQTIAELCGCAVEPRASGDPTKHRLFWGFPEHSLPKFERILIGAGYTVRVIVQNKDATGEVTSRTIDHVSSPGTFWDGDGGLAVRKDEQVMLAIYVEPYMDSRKRQKHWYMASSAFDVMTGKAVSVETDIVLIDGRPVYDLIQPFWSVYPPAEIVFFWSSTTESPPKESEILSLFPGRGGFPPVHILTLDPKKENTAEASRLRIAFLESVFRHDAAIPIAEYLGISMYHNAQRSLYHLLQFIKDHNPSFLTSLHEHSIWSSDETLLLGNSALEQLAMIPVNSDKPQESLLYWLQSAQCIMGRRALRERCLKPIADVDELEARQDRIAALRDATVRTPLENILRGCYDLPRLYRKFQLGNAKTDDLLQLIATYEKAAALLKATTGTVYEVEDHMGLNHHIETITSTWDAERIRKSKAQVDHGIAVGSTHPWKRGVQHELDTFEDSWCALEKEMLDMKTAWENALEEPDAINWNLRDDVPFTFQTTERRGKNLAALAKRRFKMEITVVKRGSSSTVMLDCPKLQEANAAAIKVRSAWRAAVQECWNNTWRIWMDESIKLGMLESLVQMIGTLDADCALAAVSEKYGYVRPKYIESTSTVPAGFTVQDLRHPIIERVHTGTPYIPHSLSYGGLKVAADAAATPQGILLYGVNAAGKSSLGKAIGLAVLMAQCGMPVPATAMTLIPYTSLFTRILGNDNLWAGMSSFVVEMTEFRSILRAAGPRTLVIGDELCAGTETASATAIVAAGVQTLTARGCHYFFATHLHELSEIQEITSNPAVAFYHLTVHSDIANQRLVYDRKLRAGTGSPMYGLEVCRGLDMDAAFLSAAFAYRKRLFDDRGGRISAYNAAVVVDHCEVCGSHQALETHHIVPQAAADNSGFIGPGKHKNTEENLVALCSSCHDAHHGGMLEIQGWIATSKGRALQYSWNK